MSRRRAGRKRKPLVKREPSGRVSRAKGEAGEAKPDKGTAELQVKRAVLAAGGDPAATTRWLDLLTAWGLISPRQQQAGADYARLRAKVFGTVSGGLKAARLDPEEIRGPAQDPSEALLTSAKRRYDRATRRLRSVSRQMETEVKELVLYDRPPLIAMSYAAGMGQRATVPNHQLSPLGGARGSQAQGPVPRVHASVRTEPTRGSSELASKEARPRMTSGAGQGASVGKTMGPKPLTPAALKQWAWLSVGLEVLDSALAEEGGQGPRPVGKSSLGGPGVGQ